MLGSLKSGGEWKWAAFGKHPVAGDYVSVGPRDPFFQAFAGWVENGYHRLSAPRKNADALTSWRFWTRSHQKDILMCGVGRDSFDAVGRPYPLVIMGTGSLPGWQRHLAMLPFALEAAWIQMEYLATKRFLDVSQVEADIQRLPGPGSQWEALEAERKRRWDAWPPPQRPVPAHIRKQLEAQKDAPMFLVPLAAEDCRDPAMVASLWNDALGGRDAAALNAVFLGGTPDAAYLAIFRRPLAVPDFMTLWSVGAPAADYPKLQEKSLS
jgi:type VI secretion system protein VasJ